MVSMPPEADPPIITQRSPKRIERRISRSIDHLAWILIRRFGDDAVQVAELRHAYCMAHERPLSAAKRACVYHKVKELSMMSPPGYIH
jgi:hypothetical protein